MFDQKNKINDMQFWSKKRFGDIVIFEEAS